MPSGRPLGATDDMRYLNAHLAERLQATGTTTLRAYSVWEPFGRTNWRWS